MPRLDKQEGRYRVLLTGVGNNTEAEKDSFCHTLSKSYSVPLAQLRKIVDRCPVILKKNLPLNKAESLAKIFKSFGALVFVEEKRESLPISLEFQELVPHQLALESCSVRKSYVGTWSVTGRAKNISDETLSDTWVLIQVFEDFEEFVAFEETPLSINPLPSGQASPFKVIFEGAFSVKRISVGFKNASGQPVPAEDKRKKREWVKADLGDEGPLFSSEMTAELETKSKALDLAGPSEKMITEKEGEIPGDKLLSPEREVAPPVEYEIRENYGNEERVPSGDSLLLPLEPLIETQESFSISAKEDSSPGKQESEKPLGQETSEGRIIPGSGKSGEKMDAPLAGAESAFDEEKRAEESRLDHLVLQEATQLLKDISKESKEGEFGEKSAPASSWIEYFRGAVQTFYQTPHGIFPTWFEACRKKGEFKNSFHGLLTILVHSRFNQGSQSFNPLENTKKIFRLIIQPNLLPEEIPSLEGTSFASDEVWRDLFQRALPKVNQIGNAILEKNKWNVSDLERLIQVIPHMGIENSRMAIQWICELLPDVAEIDFSGIPVTVGEDLYRVAARLGIVDPRLDDYHDRNSMGDTKIQSFAIKAFPHHPSRIEKPLMWTGGREEQGGHCFPNRPRCNGCLFETFCPRLCLDFDPSEIGMRD